MSEEGPAEQQPDAPADIAAILKRITRTMVGNSVAADLDTGPLGRPTPAPASANLGRANKEVAGIYPEMHPYQPAERATPDQIREFYGNTGKNVPRNVWRDLDILLSNPGQDRQAHLNSIRDRSNNLYNRDRPRVHMPRLTTQQPPGEAMWSDGAMLRAALPAFADRLEQGSVNKATARKVHQNLVADVLPYIKNAGTLAEAIVATLLARLDPESFAFPTSSREESTSIKSTRGHLFNHDLYQLPNVESHKVPLQVKTCVHAMSKIYHPRVVRVPVLEWLAPAVVGPDWQRTNPQFFKHPEKFIAHLRNLLVDPSIRRGGNEVLDRTARHLRDKIEGSRARRRKQRPEAHVENLL